MHKLYQTPYHSKSLSESRFLITGGAGFIGSNLVEYLLRYQAKEVVVLDNLSNGYRSNLAEFEGMPNFRFVQGDILDLALCRELCGNTDYVLHQAALGSVPRSIENPIATNDANVTGFLNIITAAKDAKVKRFIYASSSSVYGDNEDLPKTEEKIGNCLSPYAVSKRTNELYGQVFHRAYGLPTIGLRYFNVFGPKQSPNGPYAAVIPIFAKTMLEDKCPWIHGRGNQTRDFTFIENVVQANIKAIEAENPKAFGQVYNAGAGGRYDIIDLVMILNEILGTSLPPQFGDARPGDIRDSFADISKAQQMLGYKPLYDFKQGLRLTMDWYKHIFKA